MHIIVPTRLMVFILLGPNSLTTGVAQSSMKSSGIRGCLLAEEGRSGSIYANYIKNLSAYFVWNNSFLMTRPQEISR